MKRLILVLTLLLVASLGAQELETTNDSLKTMLESRLQNLEGETGVWRGDYEGLTLIVLTDESHNRMRVMTPVKELSSPPDPIDMQKCMEANFASALDARYAFYRGYLWSVFVHQLSSINDTQLDSALRQVALLAATHGTEYSSGELQFSPDESQPEGEEPVQDELGLK